MKKNNLEIVPFKSKLKNSFKNIPDPLPQKHFCAVIIGKRGSGKSICAKNMIRIYKDTFKRENRFIISPTINNDDVFHDDIEPENRFSYYTDELIDFILEVIEDDVEEQKNKLKQKAIATLMNQKKYSYIEDVSELPEEAVEKMYERMLKKYFKKEDYLLILDDCQGLVKKNSKAINLCVKHRHYSISLIYMFQNFRSCPLVLRTNATLVILYDNTKTEIKKYSEEFNVFKNENDFIKMFEENIYGYNFLTINLNKQKNERYYKNFTTKINFDEYNNK